jgi:hypothetical protein
MNHPTPEPKCCTVCGDPIRPDNEIGICTDLSKPDCVNARRREYRSRNPQPYEAVTKTKQCEICGRPLNNNNRSGLCNGKESAPCLARRNKLAREARIPAGYEPRRCEICGSRIKEDNQTGICGSRARPECRKESQLRLRRLRGIPPRDLVTVTAGDVFGKWTVLESRSGNSQVPVRCECGTERDILIYNLTRSVSRSCGCLLKEASARRFPGPYIAADTVFGRLTVLEDVPRSTDKAHCLCKCGTEVVIKASSALKAGKTRSCGCLKRELHTTHGLSKHPLYKTWQGMLQRCENPAADSYERYSENDITVCEEWHDVAVFIADIEREIGPRPEGRYETGMPHLTLDRIDNDQGYRPGNVKWSTQSQQVRNQRKVGTLTRKSKAVIAERDAFAAKAARVDALEAELAELRRKQAPQKRSRPEGPSAPDMDTLF